MKLLHRPWWENASTDERIHRQSALLHKYLKNRVVPFTKHYRELFATHGISASDIQTTDDLIKIPFTRKRDFSNPRDFLILPEQKQLFHQWHTLQLVIEHGPRGAKQQLEQELRPALMTCTTGRSSDPVPFFYTKHDLTRLEVSGARMMQVCEAQPDYRHINAFPFAPHLAFWQAHYAGLGHTTFMLSTGGGKTMGTEGNIRMIDKINPHSIIGMPTFIYHLLQEAATNGSQWKQLNSLVLGGEKVPDGMRDKLRELCQRVWAKNVRIMSTYGFTEAKLAWSECPAPEHGSSSAGFHIYPDMGIVEVVNPDTGERVPNRHPGEIVYTQLDARGSVVLRYRTGDQIDGGLTDEPCPYCGRTCPRLVGNISRVSDIHRLHLDKLKGTLVDFNALEHLIDNMPDVGAWQVELRKRNDDPNDLDQIIVHAVAGNGTPREETMRNITHRFREKMEFTPDAIEFHSWQEMRRLQGVGEKIKEEKVVDHRPEASK